MIWKTKISQMMDTKYPIIMGAFAIIGKAEFAAPFSEAGGLGIITALNFNTKEKFRDELKKMKTLTDKPYGVNFSVFPPYLTEGKKRGLNEEHYLDYVEIAIEEGVKVCTTSAYQAPKIGKMLHDAGCY